MTRTTINPEARELAERLVAYERGARTIAAEDRHATCRACEKLRRPLSHLVGGAGIRSLFQRALTLAQRESAAFDGVEVTVDGALKGFEGEAVQQSSVLLAHLIHLLQTFIGEALTLRILHDVWPELGVLNESLERSGS